MGKRVLKRGDAVLRAAMPRRILIVKMSSIGDVLLATPVARALREAFPEAHLAWVVDQRCAAVVEGNPYLDQVITIPANGKWSSLAQYWREIRKLPPFDCTLDLHGLARSAIATRASRAPLRVGLTEAREFSHLAYNAVVEVPPSAVHRVDFCAEFLEILGVPVRHRQMLLPTRPEHEQEARELLAAEALGSGPLVTLSLTAGRDQKCWMVERYAEVADRLMDRGCRVAVIGGGGKDRLPVEEMKALMRHQPADLAGRINLKTLAALLRLTDVFLSADTGPMHIAASVQTPTVALFGPTDPSFFGPYGTEHTIIRKQCRCAPRWRHPVCENRECMRAITVDEVEEAVLALLERMGALHKPKAAALA